MGQKVNPIGLRIGINKTWDSLWYAGKRDYAAKLHQDLQIKEYIQKKLAGASVSKVRIERLAKKIRIMIHTAKAGIVIGKKGGDIAIIKAFVEKMTGSEVAVNVVEIRRAETDATLIADNIAKQIENRVSFKKAMKKSIQSAMKMGAGGIRVNVSGRLGGAEIARMEWYREGRVPLHTLRADIDYGMASAHTTYGVIGIKVWVYHMEKQTQEKSRPHKDIE